MANWTAIGAITATLEAEIRAAAAGRIPNVDVTTGRPRQPTGAGQNRARVNLFLYAILPSPAYRNEELPVRGAAGQLVDRPVLPVDLHYLVSLLGSQDSYVPELLAGAILTRFHSVPFLTADRMRDAVDGVLDADAQAFGGAVPNLDQQEYRIRVTPMSLGTEEITNLWSALGADFSTTMALEASVVLLEPDIPSPGPALPVLDRDVRVLPTMGPRIDAVDPADLTFDLATWLTIRGTGFDAPDLLVRIGDVEAGDPQKLSTNELKVRIPAGTPAGTRMVRVIQRIEMGDPRTKRPALESNTALLTVRPAVTVTGSIAGGDAVADVTPFIEPGQDASLLLSPRAPSPSLTDDRRIDTRVATGVVAIGAGTLTTGDYFVRVSVDGIESALETDAKGRPTGPVVTVP